MAIRVNDNGTVVIERVLKVTKELETSDLSSFEDNFNRMMHNYSEAFKTALSKRLEACEEAVATAKENSQHQQIQHSLYIKGRIHSCLFFQCSKCYERPSNETQRR